MTTSGDCGWDRKLLKSQAIPLKRPAHRFICWPIQGYMRRKWIVWCQGEGWRGNFLLDRSAGRCHCSFIEPFPHPAGRCRQATSASLLVWLTPFVSLWWFSEIPTASHMQATQAAFGGSSIQPVSACATDCPKISQRFTNPKQAIGLSVPFISC